MCLLCKDTKVNAFFVDISNVSYLPDTLSFNFSLFVAHILCYKFEDNDCV